eukprot:gene25158-31581_t
MDVHQLSRQYDAVILSCGAGVERLWTNAFHPAPSSTDNNTSNNAPISTNPDDNATNISSLSPPPRRLNLTLNVGHNLMFAANHQTNDEGKENNLLPTLLNEGVGVLCGEYVVQKTVSGQRVLLVGSCHEKDESFDSYYQQQESLKSNQSLYLTPIATSSGVKVLTPRTKAGRLPFVGRHPVLRNVWMSAGFGSRGLLHHGTAAEFLTTAILSGDESVIPSELSVRSDTETSPTECKVRSRLTPSGPSKAGSMWFLDPAPVSNGFDTYFTFQISDHSKQCTTNKDQYFSLAHHLTCSVHGADGFAFVLQLQGAPENSTSIVGQVGGQMGFGGIPNSLAIAFDTWQNQGSDTVGVDHISVQSLGHAANDALEAGLLGVPRATTLADGKVHLARIAYFGDLQTKYLDQLVASDSLLPYLKDNGEQKRIGTLVVFLDDGIASDTPILALPINLSLLLDLPTDQAYVGFTASTGRFYEKHDILSWVWCDQQPCEADKKRGFDYHQQSRFSSETVRDFSPGAGYGGGDTTEGFPIKNTSPDTDPWTPPLSSFSHTRNHNLSYDSVNQVPPNTIY